MTVIHHINASCDELVGNQGIGRYLFLTGSDERAQAISDHFHQPTVCRHPRHHNLYLGTLKGINKTLDVAAISTGIGGSSADIIINELILLGARRLLRVGTAGSLQPKLIHTGDTVIATAAIRDDKASWDYIYPEYPAIASLEYIIAAARATTIKPTKGTTHMGIVHSKSSLYAREYMHSFLPENSQYMTAIKHTGAVATEMECAQLFILSSLMSAKHQPSINPVLCGAILAIVGDATSFSTDKKIIDVAINAVIDLSIETTKQLALIDGNNVSLF